MRSRVVVALVAACGLLLLGRELSRLARETPVAATPPARAVGVGDGVGVLGPRHLAAGAAPASVGSIPATVAPPGGVRTWSATAAPTDGPDPFAPVPQVRSLADTRAGLDE